MVDFPSPLLAVVIWFVVNHVTVVYSTGSVSLSFDRDVNTVTDIYVGQTDTVNVTMTMQDGILSISNVTIVLMASTSPTRFAVVGLTAVSQSSDITIGNPNWQTDYVLSPGLEYTDPNLTIYYNSRATFDLGTVTSNGVGGSSYITMTCDLVCVDVGTSISDEHFISAMVTMESNATVYLSQRLYRLEMILNPNHTNEASVMIGTLPQFEDGGKLLTTECTIKHTHAQARLDVEAFVVNATKSVSPILIEVTSVGGAYSYSLRPHLMRATRYEQCFVEDSETQVLVLNIGTVINKESQKAVPAVWKSTIDIRISWLVFDTQSVGNTYALGLGFGVGDTVYFNIINVAIVERNPPTSPLAPLTAASVGPSTVRPGGVCTASIVLDTPQGSLNNYQVDLITRQMNGSESKLMLMSHTFGSRGDNLPCEPTEIHALTRLQPDTTNPAVIYEGNMTFEVLNTGLMTTNNQEINVKMLAIGDAVKDTVHKLDVVVNGIGTSTEFIIGDSVPINANFTATANGTGTIMAGGFSSVNVNVRTLPETADKYIVNLLTREKNGTASHLSIVYTTFSPSDETKTYVLEDSVKLTSARTDATQPYVSNAGNLTFIVINTGDLTSNDVEFLVHVVASVDAVNGSAYEVVVDIGGYQEVVEMTIEGQKQQNTDVAYSVTMNVSGTRRLAPGDIFTVEAILTTTPDTSPGNMAIILPEPLKPNFTPYVTFIGARTIFKGANVVCPPSDSIDHVMSSWNNWLLDNQKATVIVPYMCNIQTETGDASNTWVIEMDLRLLNHTDLQGIEQQLTFGVTMNFSDDQFYSGNVTITSVSENSTGPANSLLGPFKPAVNASGAPYWYIVVGIVGTIALIAALVAIRANVKKRLNKIQTSSLSLQEFERK